MPVTFGNDEEALQALQDSSAVADLSHWDRLHVSGKDRLTFLHGQVYVFHLNMLQHTQAQQRTLYSQQRQQLHSCQELQQRHAATP